jgi:hypothetical protein
MEPQASTVIRAHRSFKQLRSLKKLLHRDQPLLFPRRVSSSLFIPSHYGVLVTSYISALRSFKRQDYITLNKTFYFLPSSPPPRAKVLRRGNTIHSLTATFAMHALRSHCMCGPGMPRNNDTLESNLYDSFEIQRSRLFFIPAPSMTESIFPVLPLRSERRLSRIKI